jgi:prolyl-tRNA synthetase
MPEELDRLFFFRRHIVKPCRMVTKFRIECRLKARIREYLFNDTHTLLSANQDDLFRITTSLRPLYG